MWSDRDRQDRREGGRQFGQAATESRNQCLFPQVLLLLPDRYNKIVVGADQSFNRMSSVMVGNMATYVRRCWSKAKEK